MKTQLIFWISIILVGSVIAQNNYMKQWPQFRGPFASGIMDSANLPDKWNIRTGENIKWKVDIPGLGHSCPVIWENKLFITTAISSSGKDSLKAGLYGNVDNIDELSVHEFRLLCINKYTGDVIWDRMAHKGIPKTKRHTKASHADPTTATNGKYVVAFFGSNGLYCYNFEGELIWQKEFDKMNAGFYRTPKEEWDISSSPIIHDNTLIIQCDYLEGGFIVAYDIENGEEKWHTQRNDVSTYSVPNLYNHGNINEIIVNGYKHIGGYDFNTGKEIWKLSGGGDVPVPTPFFAHGLIYIHSAHGKNSPIFAVKPEAKGDITLGKDETTNEFIVWSVKRGGAYIPTNIVYNEYLYNLNGWSGKLTCYNALTGKLIYEDKLPDARGITASAIASDGRLFYTTEPGNIFVIEVGNKFNILSINPLDDTILATPAISENMLYFRTQHYLIAVGN